MKFKKIQKPLKNVEETPQLNEILKLMETPQSFTEMPQKKEETPKQNF